MLHIADVFSTTKNDWIYNTKINSHRDTNMHFQIVRKVMLAPQCPKYSKLGNMTEIWNNILIEDYFKL